MKNIIKTATLLLLILSTTITKAQSVRNCGTTEYTNHQISTIPGLSQKYEEQETAIRNWIKKGTKDNSVIIVPVIFHVLYNNNSTNISDAQIASQIDILNDDYARQNTDTFRTPSLFKGVASSVGIQFCVAHQDPSGNWTNGITRTQTAVTQFDLYTNNAKYTSQGGHDAWNTSLYLNIWVVPEIVAGGMSGILGYAQMPGGAAATDGVVVGYNYVGNIGTAQYPFNKGRTLTHEVGHYFNLRHIWADDGGSCSGTDYVNDTPNQSDKNFGCPSHPHKSCNNDGDMFQNYMDYTNDACMNLFTKGQGERMIAAINTSRASLKTSGMCQANYMKSIEKDLFNISPNPVTNNLNISINNNNISEINILDITGKIVLSTSSSKKTISINTSDIKNGVYLIQVKNEEKVSIKKVIIQH